MTGRPHTSDFLERFYEHLDEDDWLDGVDLYQAGKVSQIQAYQGLITAKVSSNVQPTQEVRVKVHPSGTVIQWVECTCRKNRAYGQFCEHIAALMIHIDREKKELLGKLDSKMPLKPPHAKRARRSAQSDPKENEPPKIKSKSASQSLLGHLGSSVHNVSLLGQGPCLRIRLEIKPGTLTHYDLDLDESARFLSQSNNLKSAQQSVKDLRVFAERAHLGTWIFHESDEKIVAERSIGMVLAQEIADQIGTSLGKLTPRQQNCRLVLNSGSHPIDDTFLLFSYKAMQKFVGKDYFFIQGLGYFPLDTDLLNPSWYELPLSKNHKDDDAARLVESNFGEYRQHGPLWLDGALKNSLIMEAPTLSEISIMAENEGWFHLDPKYGKGESTISMVELSSQFRSKKRRFIKSGDVWFKVPDFVTEYDWKVDETGQYLKVDALGLMRLKAAMGDFDQFVGSKQILGKIRDRFEFNLNESPLPPFTNTNLNLRGYQEDGVRWLWWLYKNDLHGLLADEMGLGKTHQAMALLSAILEEKKGESIFLVVCPTTVLDHWEDKLVTFAPNLNPIKFHGPKRLTILDDLGKTYNCLITSYGVLLRDIKHLINKRWDAIILDEAHYVKNHNTATYKAACKLNSKIRLCLTGTPMENHLGELKNLFDFLVPGYLGSDQYFKEHFLSPIEQEKDLDRELSLQKLVHPFKLRRIKETVLKDLPSKVEDIRHCYLSPGQVKLYREIIEMRARPLLDQLTNESSPIPYLHVFATLQMLKQVCDHPALIKKDEENYEKYESGKFEVTKEIIHEALDSGNKIVIFSQYLGMIRIFRDYFTKEGIGHVTMTGQTRHRGKVIEQFQTDESIKIFVGSLLAGGIGIDLTSASVVIHYDRWWNPTKEDQATDRVHRIGQKKFVQVMKMVTRGTLEEKIDLIIKGKQSLFKKFIERDEELFKSLSRQDLIEILQ
jgi:superfamily II DNA or RNA helicase